MSTSEGSINHLSLFGRTLRWYLSGSGSQYKKESAELYDQAADVLSGRTEFAKLLTQCMDGDPGVVLELASGTGLISQVLAKRYPKNTIIYSDLSTVALNTLRKRVSNPDVVASSFLENPLKSDSIDTVVCVGGYRYLADFEDESTFWRELDRIVKPGGKVLLAQFLPLFFFLKGKRIGSKPANSHFSLLERKDHISKLSFNGLPIPTGNHSIFIFEKES